MQQFPRDQRSRGDVNPRRAGVPRLGSLSQLASVPLFVGVGFASCETPTNKEHEMTQSVKDTRGSAKERAIFRANGKDRANVNVPRGTNDLEQIDWVKEAAIEAAILKFEKARMLYRLEAAIKEFQS